MNPLDQIRASFRAQLPDVIGSLRAKAADHQTVALERGYTIQNAADEAVVRIYDEIWWLGVNAQDLASDLDAITAPKIRVEINSPGGDVWDGIAIYNALRNHPAHVTTRVDGMAASIASVIAQAGDSRVMVTGSQMMIHNAWGMTVGDHNDHADMAAILQQQDAVIAGIYASRSGKDADEFRTLMDAETWLTAETAVHLGLADEVYEPPKQDAPSATLADQISSAIDAAERVAALRAEAGKNLSMVNHESLVGLRGRIDALLDGGGGDTEEETQDERIAALLDENRRRAAARLAALGLSA